MEDLLVILVTGLILSGTWIMVRDFRRIEEEFRNYQHSEPDYWRLGGDEGRHDGCDTIDASKCSNWDWLELLDVG